MADGADKMPLIDALRDEVSRLAAGTRLPTIRDVSGRYGVSQFAAQRAYEALKEEGLIQSFVGRGSFAAGSIPPAGATRTARILIVSHATPSQRGADIANELRAALDAARHKTTQVTYSDVEDLHDLLGRGGFDVCVLQPRRSILPVEALALLKSKAQYMIVEGRQLELMNVDIFVRNRAKSMAIALRHLRELDHRRIGLLTERLDVAAGYAEVDNLFTQMLGADPDLHDGPVLRVGDPNGRTLSAGLIAATLDEARDAGVAVPTAYLVSGGFTAEDIQAGFAAAGLDIPSDVSVVHLRASPGDVEDLTTVGRTAAQVARGLSELINWRLSNPKEPGGLVLDDPVLHIGPSSRAIGGSTT